MFKGLMNYWMIILIMLINSENNDVEIILIMIMIIIITQIIRIVLHTIFTQIIKTLSLTLWLFLENNYTSERYSLTWKLKRKSEMWEILHLQLELSQE